MTTIQRYGNTRGLEGLPTISQFVVHDGVVHLLGVTGDPGGDVRTQTRDVLARIDKLLLRAGTDRSQLLTAQVWLRTMEDFDAHNEEWNAWVDSDEPPVRVCVQAELWQPELLVEIMSPLRSAAAIREPHGAGRRRAFRPGGPSLRHGVASIPR